MCRGHRDVADDALKGNRILAVETQAQALHERLSQYRTVRAGVDHEAKWAAPIDHDWRDDMVDAIKTVCE
jgi:hypothetical protein